MNMTSEAYSTSEKSDSPCLSMKILRKSQSEPSLKQERQWEIESSVDDKPAVTPTRITSVKKVVAENKSSTRECSFRIRTHQERPSKTPDRGRSRSISPRDRKFSNPPIATEEQMRENYRNVVQRVHAVIFAHESETRRGIDNKLGLSLSGCGFLGSYHFGAVICFQRHAKMLMSKVTHVGGASVGSLIAALIALAPDSIEDALKQLYILADEINANALGAMAPGFCLAERLSLLVDKFVPDDVASAENRLHVSVTKQSNYANRLISSFPSREYLMTCLSASCYIPIYSSGYFATAPKIDEELYIDGGYSNNLPVFENVPTITISPFSGSAIIAPTDRSLFEWKMRLGNQVMKVNLQNVVRGAQALFPPSTNVLQNYYEMGYRDAMKFLMKNNFFERNEGTEL